MFNRDFLGITDDFKNFLEKTTLNESYPPYNIIKTDDETGYIVEIAVAGFKSDDLEVTLENNHLTIIGKSNQREKKYIHRGISERKFTRIFKLYDNIEIQEVILENGILMIKMKKNTQEIKKLKILEIK